MSLCLVIAALVPFGPTPSFAMRSDNGHAARIFVKQPGTEGTYLEVTGSIEDITDAYIVVVDKDGRRVLYERAAVHHVELTTDPEERDIAEAEVGETVKQHWSWRREGQLLVVLKQLPGVGPYLHGTNVPHIPRDLDVMLAVALFSLVCAFGIYKVYETVVLNRIKVQLEIRQLQGQLGQDPAAPPLEGMIGFLKHRVLGVLAEAEKREREDRWRQRWRKYRETSDWLPATVYLVARILTFGGAVFVLLMGVGFLGVAASDTEQAAIGTRLTALALAVVSVAGFARLARTLGILRRSFDPTGQTGVRHAMLYACGLVAIVAFNARFALTRTERVDLTVVPPLLVMLLAYRFGAFRAAGAGLLAAGLHLVHRVAAPERDDWERLLYGDFSLGALYIPHSSLEDLIRLVLLGGLAGWLFAWARRVTPQTGWHTVAERRPAGPRLGGSHVVRIAGFVLGTAAIILSNAIYRLPDRSSVPFSGLSLIVCCGAGFLLGPRRGLAAGGAAALVSIVSQGFLAAAMPRVRFELAEVGHLLSFALMGFWSGRIAESLGSREAVRRAAARLDLSPKSRGPSQTSPAWFIPALLLFSVIWTVKSGRSTDLQILVLPLTMATVMLMGATGGARSAAWTVGVTLGAWTLLGHGAEYGGWLPTVKTESLTISLHPRWSAPGIVVLATGAWLAGKMGLATSRRNRYWLAVAIFVALELSNILRYGIFLLPYVKGVVAGTRIDLVSGVARLAEPWLTVLLFGLGLEGLRRSGRARVRQPA